MVGYQLEVINFVDLVEFLHSLCPFSLTVTLLACLETSTLHTLAE